VRCLTQCHCYGSPQFTFSDVERAISAEVRLLGYVDIYDSRLRRETETRERQQLAALQAKYQPADATSWEVTEGEPFVTRPLPPLPALPAGPDVQFSLFG
jgi:hypothetical protein